MSIEFRCIQCLHLQKVDESKIGQQVYCHVCYFKLTVPAESTVKPVDESQLYNVDDKPSDVRDRQELISFECITCHTNISVRTEQVGEKIVCPECGKKIIVPKSVADKAKAKRLEKLDKAIALARYKEIYSLQDGTTVATNDGAKRFRFLCRLCGTTLFATEEQVGTLVTCPDCDTKTEVPPPPKKIETAPLQPLSFEGGTIYDVATSSSVASKEILVPVVCRHCGTRMHAGKSHIGQFKTCPDCGKQTEIKAVPKPKKRTTETTSADAYVLNEADETSPPPARIFRSLSPSLLRKRQDELESFRSLNRPQLPKRPLTERFFVPFRFLDTWVPVLLFVLVVPLGAIGIYWAVDATGGGAGKVAAFSFAFFSMFFGLLIFMLFVAASSYFATFALFLYDITYSGEDETVFEGEIAPIDYFFNGLWLFIFSIIAATPGWFFGEFLLQSPDSTTDFPVTIVMMRISHWFFFPIFFLSSMESGSMFALLAKNMVMSLFRQPFAWFRFYLLTGILFVLSDLGIILVAVLSSPTDIMFCVGIAMFFFLFAIQSLFFFRLLGRHAWLLEETDRRRREREDEQDML
jgi:DNA-directed RNA polymerase subunit RPC12/RpoP